MLVRCIDVNGGFLVFKVRFMVEVENEYKFCFFILFLDIWLYFFDWIEVIEFFIFFF